MSLSAAILSTTLALLLLSSSCTVDGRPSRFEKRHAVQKRATLEDTLGDLSAQAPGILNEDSKTSSYRPTHFWYTQAEL